MKNSDAKALEKMLELSRFQTNECASRVADLEAALASANASLDWLQQAVRSEQVSLGGSTQGVLDLKRFLSGSEQKRLSLEATRDTLAVQIDESRKALSEALTEQKKFEHLLERIAVVQKSRATKVDQAIIDHAAQSRFAG
jgi:flagellar export protein FliJ